ncbi:HMG domain-containing protein 3 [Brachionichthys hirsutus]|uniref:HMG domain-containing protein 3 n=1 Tax=Brachionichthys hirsutus TaxID=412623 RepID=UPI0036050EC6
MEKLEVFEVVKVTEEVESCSTRVEVTTPKKRKSKTQELAVDKPKKPRSAYLLYYFDALPDMQQEVLNIPQSEINKRISESWKRLSVSEKAYYLEKAKSEKEGMDTTSLSPSKDLPGFRKILPRASYFLLSNGCASNHKLASLPKMSVETLDSSVEGGLPSISLTQEPQFTPLGLAGEVELSEQPVLVDDMPGAPHPVEPQGIPPASMDIQISAEPTTNVATLNGNEARVNCRGYCGPTMQQNQGETAQVVAIIPAQNLLEPNSLAGVSSVGSVMMVSVGSSMEQSAKTSYKMSVKTYTRRGRGRCLNAGCSFVYVTRHKPPVCPECGSHLGGKWRPAKKEKDVGSNLQTDESKAAESHRPTPPPDQESKTNTSGNRKGGQVQRTPRKPHPGPAVKPAGGSSIKEQKKRKQLKDVAKVTAAQGRCRGNAVVRRRPVRPILPACSNTGSTLFQILTVPPETRTCQTTQNNKSTATVAQDGFSGLKPSTLKQLGQVIPAITPKQVSSVPVDGIQAVSSWSDRRVNILPVVPLKQRHTISSFDLGLSTARGRGRCKNSSCDYMYKNRHKPAACPKCGCELSLKYAKGTKSVILLNPQQALSPSQKDIQRQNTLQLLHRTLQIPESEIELQEILALIQELNSVQIVLVQPGHQELDIIAEMETLVETGWPQFYESAATHCGLCNIPLFKGDQSTIAGQENCWLLTETLLQTASLQLKVCLNIQCLALHSFTDLHPGLFNVGNRLLVSIDLFLKLRAGIKQGLNPYQAARTILDHVPSHPGHTLNPEELSQIQELLLSGYWAFECLTARDYNDMICGICGVAPRVEISQRYASNVLELKNVEFTWPDVSVSDEVHVDDFWLTMESEAIEQAAFPTDVPITRVDASIIAPFIPPLMRSATVINTEKNKVLSQIEEPSGDSSVLVRLIHDGLLRLDKIEDHSEDELRKMLHDCGSSVTPDANKNDLLASLVSLYTHVHSGLSTAPQPPTHLTAGKLSKVCPHKVVCGSKYLVRGETARDHVDLLLSARYWPPVYVSDCARQVALCSDTNYPELATQMWGRNQGCFSDPFEKPVLVSCAELQEQPYSADLSLVAENQLVHPITKSSCCWLVHPGAREPSANHLEHHSMTLCRDLEPYIGLVSELENEDVKATEQNEQMDKSENDCAEKPEDSFSVSFVRRQPVVFSNAAYYYLYNRLVDFLTSRDIVSQQISQVVNACQPGEVVIRDALYRLGVAQINTEKEEDEGSGMEGQIQESGTETEVGTPE